MELKELLKTIAEWLTRRYFNSAANIGTCEEQAPIFAAEHFLNRLELIGKLWQNNFIIATKDK